MKRKIIQLGSSTLVASLPSKWAKLHHLKPGDELELEEEGSIIRISAKKGKKETPSIEVDLTGKKLIIHRMLSAIYKAGFDKLTVKYKSPDELEIIQRTINQEFIGFEIVEHEKNHIVAKEISKTEYSEFNVMLRRTFLFLLSVAEEALQAIEKNDKVKLQNLVLRDRDINKLTDFCRRVLNKEQSGSTERTKPLYFMVEEIEKIGDDYRDLLREIVNNNVKLSKDIMDFFREVNRFLRFFYDTFYNYSNDNIAEFVKKKKELERKYDVLLKKAKPGQIKALIYIHKILYLTFDMNGPLMAYKLG